MTGAPALRRRPILGMSAVLLPFTADGAVDWPGFESLVARTVEAGLVPAVNMDTGYVQLLDADTRARASCGPRRPSAALPGSWPARSWPTIPAPRSTSTRTPARWTRSARRGARR